MWSRALERHRKAFWKRRIRAQEWGRQINKELGGGTELAVNGRGQETGGFEGEGCPGGKNIMGKVSPSALGKDPKF